MIKESILVVSCVSLFIGCSPKAQIAPNGSDYEISQEEKDFKGKKELNEKMNAAFKSGKESGYQEAKAEFEKIIPYIEAIRASAELKNSGGLCMPPLFLDRSNPSRVAVVLGEAHVCPDFTVDNVLAVVKHGIPGMPETKSTAADVKQSTASGVSSVSLAGVDARDFFVESVSKVEQAVKVTVADTFTNREILRTSNFKYAKSEIGNNDSLIIEFARNDDAKAFCEKYSICKIGGK